MKIYFILIYIYIQAENGIPKKKTENFVSVLTSSLVPPPYRGEEV